MQQLKCPRPAALHERGARWKQGPSCPQGPWGDHMAPRSSVGDSTRESKGRTSRSIFKSCGVTVPPHAWSTHVLSADSTHSSGERVGPHWAPC